MTPNEIVLTSSTFVIKSVELRHTVDEAGMPWFVAKDVCDYLGLKNVSDACSRLFDGTKGIASSDTLGGAQSMITVNEPGLYQLIFQSRKPEAEAFQRWVFTELLPTLRRTGRYEMPGHETAGLLRSKGQGRQPILDEIKKRGLTQRQALETMNALELDVPLIKSTNFPNMVYGNARPSVALAVRASALLGVPAEALFTRPPRE